MFLKYYYVSAASCASFLALYRYINPTLTLKFFPEFKSLALAKQIEWSSRTNSSLHAILVSMLCLYCLIYEDDISRDPVWGESDLVRMSCAIVVGYMFSDGIIVMVHYSKFGEIFFLFHHIASIYAFCFAMTYGALLWFANVRLIAEFSTPFVNKRWFLDVLGYTKSSPPFIFNGISMMVIFFLVRVISIPFYWFKVYTIYGTEEANTLGKIWYVLISSCLILDAINVYWFFKITQGIVKLLKTNGTSFSSSNPSSSLSSLKLSHNLPPHSHLSPFLNSSRYHNDAIKFPEPFHSNAHHRSNSSVQPT